MDYSLCTQTVTVYRKTPETIFRQELPGCFLQWREEETFDRLGRKKERKFLLIQPGQVQRVFLGDWIYNGIGPEMTEDRWDDFRFGSVANLAQVNYASPYWWQGQILHTEAGRK